MRTDETNNGPDPAEWAVLVALTCIGLALRMSGLARESIWYDESFSLRLVQAGAAKLLTGEAADPGNPAGYFVLLALWQLPFGDSIEAARALSALAGTLTIPGVWLLARSLRLSRGCRLLATLLVTLSPPLIYLAQEARCYSLFIAVATLLATSTEICTRSRRLADWLGFVALGAAAVHLHYYGFIVLVALGLRLLFVPGQRGRLIAAAAAIAIAFAPYIPVFRWQLSLGSSRSGETWLQHLLLLPLYSVAGRTAVWKEQGTHWVALADAGLAALAYMPVLPAIVMGRRRLWTPLAASIGVMIVATAISLTLSPMIHSHYISSALPPLAVLLSFGIVESIARRPRQAATSAVVLAAATVVALLGLYGRKHKTDWRSVAEFVAVQASGRPVYFFEDIGADPYRYYRPDDDCRLIVDPFGANGADWERAGWLGRMRGDARGFVLLFYATNSVNRAALPACKSWLSKHFRITDEQVVGPVGPIHIFVAAPAAVLSPKNARPGQPGS